MYQYFALFKTAIIMDYLSFKEILVNSFHLSLFHSSLIMLASEFFEELARRLDS